MAFKINTYGPFKNAPTQALSVLDSSIINHLPSTTFNSSGLLINPSNSFCIAPDNSLFSNSGNSLFNNSRALTTFSLCFAVKLTSFCFNPSPAIIASTTPSSISQCKALNGRKAPSKTSPIICAIVTFFFTSTSAGVTTSSTVSSGWTVLACSN